MVYDIGDLEHLTAIHLVVLNFFICYIEAQCQDQDQDPFDRSRSF